MLRIPILKFDHITKEELVRDIIRLFSGLIFYQYNNLNNTQTFLAPEENAAAAVRIG